MDIIEAYQGLDWVKSVISDKLHAFQFKSLNCVACTCKCKCKCKLRVSAHVIM